MFAAPARKSSGASSSKVAEFATRDREYRATAESQNRDREQATTIFAGPLIQMADFARVPVRRVEPDVPADWQFAGTGAQRGVPGVQAKMAIGAVDDPLEQEADAVADRVAKRMHVGAIGDIGAPSIQSSQTDGVEEGEQRLVDDDNPTDIVQAKADGNSTTAGRFDHALKQGTSAGAAMNPSLLHEMEGAFEADFSNVRIHTDSSAERLNRSLGAQAFTCGTHIYFNKGGYRPETYDGRHLLAHELTHVVQQAGVARPVGIGAAGKSGTTQTRPLTGLVQRKSEKDSDFVPYRIYVSRPMSREEFQALAMQQIFGAVIPKGVWENAKDSYGPDKSPYTVNVDVQLLKKYRGEASRERGIPTESGGGITGAEERAKTFHATKESDEKSALMDEIDRRYFEAVGDQTKTKIKSSEKGKAALWSTIRDEVLFQHEYVKNLPPNVKELIKFGTSGRELTPADYDRLFSIAKKIEKMPAGQASDYASKVTGATTDLNVLEASLDKYIAEAAARDKQTEERDTLQTKLLGLEDVYKNYRIYKSLQSAGSGLAVAGRYSPGAVGAGVGNTMEAMKARKELETQLQAHGFSGIADFEQHIKNFETAFERGAASIAKDLLAKLAGKLYRESERYKDPGQLSDLHSKLGSMRTSYAEFETNAKIWNDYASAKQKASDQSRLPGQGHIKTSDFTSTTTAEAEDAKKKAESAKASAKSQFEGLVHDHPIFQEEGLPEDKKLDKVGLAKASETQLGVLLQAQIQRRMGDVGEAKAEIEGKAELIYKMDKLMPQFYALQGIRPGSIHDMIIQDKMRSDAIMKLAKGIALGIVGIAIAVLSFGTATPAIIAAGAAIAGATLGAYQAYESYQEYVEEKHLADVGLAKDPSVVWLVIAVAGAALDMAAAVKAVKALGPAAKALEGGGDLAEFNKAVAALEKAREIDAKIALAAKKAAEARKSLAQSSKDLGKVFGKLYSLPGPLADKEFYAALLKMARDAIKTKAYDAAKFLEEIKLARINAKLGELKPEELAKVKQAWEEAKVLEAGEAAIEAAEKAGVGSYTTKIEWGIFTGKKAIEARPHTSIKGGFWARRQAQGNPRVDKFELKINPNNESFFLTHPDGSLVQFENLVGTAAVQDGKLVMKSRSIYHVADMPPFATKSVLEEARRQAAAASKAGLKVEWLVSEDRAVSQLTKLFEDNGIAITVRPFAE